MRKNIYINGIGAVSTQGVWKEDMFAEGVQLHQAINRAIAPSYKELIAPAMIRRMSSGIKMGIFASQQALDEASVEIPDAIITGTGLGCSQDSEKFLQSILGNDEEYLTPTSFIQSTHNTVAAQIALRLGCKGYNFTYVHRSISFESALLDAVIQLEENQLESVLVGGVDEISTHTYGLLQLIGEIKQDGVNETVRESVTPGVNYAEGATFFMLSSQRTESSYACLVDLILQHDIPLDGVNQAVENFMKQLGMACDQIDAVVFGVNGDQEFDQYYDVLGGSFSDKPIVFYKHMTGQYDTGSAVGLAVAAQLIKEQEIPSTLLWNVNSGKSFKYVLVYNQLKGKDHSIILVRAC